MQRFAWHGSDLHAKILHHNQPAIKKLVVIAKEIVKGIAKVRGAILADHVKSLDLAGEKNRKEGKSFETCPGRSGGQG